MPIDDIDLVSDLNNGTATDETIPANAGDVSHHGGDAVEQNQGAKTREAVQPAKVVKTDTSAEKPLSLRDQISSALKGEEGTPAAALQDGGPARNPDGTFAPKPAVDPAAPPVVAAPSTSAAPTGIDPQVFASLPAETQAALARTMEDVNARQQRFARLEPVEQLIAPRVDAWALGGMAPAQALQQLFALSDFAGRDPGGFIKYIAHNNGVNLEELVLGMEPTEPVDPKIAALEKQIADLKGHVDGQTREQQQAAHQRTVDGVAGFATEKGQDGQLLRPHFGELGQAILPYVTMVKAQNPNWTHPQVLQEAYDRACWGTASVRAKLQAAVDTAAEAARLREGAKRVESARAASVGVRSGAPASAPAAPNEPSRNLRDTIKASIAANS